MSKKTINLFKVLALLTAIGGIFIFQSYLVKQEQEKQMQMRQEQDRMADYLVSHYGGVEKIKFNSFVKNNITGTFTSNAEIDDEFEVTFHLYGEKGDISLDYYTNSFLQKHPKINSEVGNDRKIVVNYFSD